MLRRTTLAIALGAALLGLAAPAQAAPLDALLAPPSACPKQDDPKAKAAVQLRAMHCLTNYARKARGLPRLRRVAALDRAAGRKAADILSCDEFSHQACGREFTHWMERSGYLPSRGCWRAAENIAWGTGALGAPRTIFRAWIRSAGHRRNILGSSFHDLGVGLRTGNLDGTPGASVWTQAFASRAC